VRQLGLQRIRRRRGWRRGVERPLLGELGDGERERFVVLGRLGEYVVLGRFD
jgi:hypothetical protein